MPKTAPPFAWACHPRFCDCTRSHPGRRRRWADHLPRQRRIGGDVLRGGQPDQVVQMLWNHNARIARAFFPDLGPDFGQLAVGAPADIIFIDYDPPTPLDTGNLPWHMIFGIDGTEVDTTIVDGKVLMRDRRLLTLDEPSIMSQARELAGRLWKRA